MEGQEGRVLTEMKDHLDLQRPCLQDRVRVIRIALVLGVEGQVWNRLLFDGILRNEMMKSTTDILCLEAPAMTGDFMIWVLELFGEKAGWMAKSWNELCV